MRRALRGPHQMANKYLTKIAELTEGQKEAVGTGMLAGLGGIGTLASDAAMRKLTPMLPKSITPETFKGKAIKFGVGGGIGLGLDYIGVKAMKNLNGPQQ